VLFVGAAGAGRSALLDEIVRRASSMVSVLRVGARHVSGPYAVARALVLAGAIGDQARARLKALGLPEATVSRLRRIFLAEGAVSRASADAGDNLMLDELAVVDALEAAVGPSDAGGVIVVDDWGSVDSGSRAALARVGARGTPVSVMATALPEDRMPEGFARVQLAALSDGELRALVARQLDVAEIPQPLAAYVGVHAGGSPTLARLIVEGLLDASLVTVTDGRAQAASNLASTPAPASLWRVFEARFDRLTDETRTLLRAAAILGDEFSGDVAGAMVGIDGKLRAPALLAPAVQADLVEELTPTTYGFRRSELRRAVVSRILQNEQLALHRRALELLEPQANDADVVALEALARHAEAARDDGRLAGWSWRAARALDARGARREAVDWFKRALDVAERVARRSTTEADVVAVVKLTTEAIAAAMVVDAGTAVDLWKHCAGFVALAPGETRAMALRMYGRALIAAGRAQEASTIFDQALEVVPDGDDDTRALLLSELGGALEATGDVQGAVAQLAEAFRRMQGRQNRHADFAFEALNRLGRLYLRNKLTARAKDAFQLAQSQAEGTSDDSGVSRCLTNLGTCAALEGDVTKARELYAAAVDRAARAGDATQAARARLNLGRLLAQSDPAAARAALNAALFDAERVGWREGIALGRNALAGVRG
jgi:tetratricopeptide (TPR) repeat protein